MSKKFVVITKYLGGNMISATEARKMCKDSIFEKNIEDEIKKAATSGLSNVTLKEHLLNEVVIKKLINLGYKVVENKVGGTPYDKSYLDSYTIIWGQ